MSLQTVFHYLVDQLQHIESVKSVRVLDQGAMLVDIARPSFHEEIVVYLLAGELSVGFVKKTLNANTNADRYTLYVLSLDLISPDGKNAYMTEGLRLLMQAYGGMVYAYQVADTVTVFPVYVDRVGHITCGASVDLTELGGDYAMFDNRYLLGVRKVANFKMREFRAYQTGSSASNPMQPFYDLLGVSAAASAADVKKAYRRKARQHHPDTDKSPNATAVMQQINEAYRKIMERLSAY